MRLIILRAVTIVWSSTWDPQTALDDAVLTFQALKKQEAATLGELVDVLVKCGRVERKSIQSLDYIMKPIDTPNRKRFNTFAEFVEDQCRQTADFGLRALTMWTKSAELSREAFDLYVGYISPKPRSPEQLEGVPYYARIAAGELELCLHPARSLAEPRGEEFVSNLVKFCLLPDLGDWSVISAGIMKDCPHLADVVQYGKRQFNRPNFGTKAFLDWADEADLPEEPSLARTLIGGIFWQLERVLHQ